MIYIVKYKAAHWLNCQAQCFGPFNTFDDAYDFLCTLPAVINDTYTTGHKYIDTLTSPELRDEILTEDNQYSESTTERDEYFQSLADSNY